MWTQVRVALALAILCAAAARGAVAAPAPSPAGAGPAAKPAGAPDSTADAPIRSLRDEVERLRKEAAEAEEAASDEAAYVRVKLQLITELLLLLFRQQEQIALQNQTLLQLLGSAKAPPADTAARTGAPAAAPGAPRAVTTTAGPLFGKRGGDKVHRAGCVPGERIIPNTRVSFATLAQAVAGGYQACKICRPER